MCSVASAKWDISGMVFYQFDIWFLFLSDDRSYYVSVAQWTAQQNPTAEASV